MFFLFSKILDFFVTPLSWILVLLALGIFSKRKPLARKCLLSSFVLLLVFTNPWIVTRVLRAWEVQSVPAQSLSKTYDVGIVMGGSMRFYDTEAKRVVYSSSVDRLIQSLELYHDGHIRKILLTGGSGFVNFQEWKESGLIAKVLLKSGVKPEDIILDNNSRNTYENAVYTKQILSSGNYGSSFLLITSAVHMRRSMACFEKQDLHCVPFSVDVRGNTDMNTLDKIIEPDAQNLWAWDSLMHEWVGYVMYQLMGYC